MAGLGLLSRGSQQHRVFDTVGEAAEWLRGLVAGADGGGPRATEIIDTVADARRAMAALD
jgi:hypothetical protein